METEERIKKLESIVADLQNQIISVSDNANDISDESTTTQFSNLEVKNAPVQFRFPNVYPKDDTAVNGSTGRIAIKTEDGTSRYLPYFATNYSPSALKIDSVALTVHNNASGDYVTSNDTINLAFKPQYVFLYGKYDRNTGTGDNVSFSGMATRDEKTAGTCSYVSIGSGTYAAGYSDSAIGIGYASSAITISNWGDSSITVTQYIYGYGAGESRFSGTLLIFG